MPQRAPADVRFYGIRHHGPGSAKAIRHALEAFAPDVLLVEGPPDSDDAIPVLMDAGSRPPVALLLHAPDHPGHSVFYPFATWSPEWQALRYATERGIPARFMDARVSERFAADIARETAALIEAEDGVDQEPADQPMGDTAAESAEGVPERSDEAWQRFAAAAGHDNPEHLWDDWVEQQEPSEQSFATVMAWMSALREDDELNGRVDDETRLREAAMRTIIREAATQHLKVAVVSGAYHSPALRTWAETAGADKALLGTRDRVKVTTTCIAWTNRRLAMASGYGAGVESPAWYQRVWDSDDRKARGIAFLIESARLLRRADLNASSAEVIEAWRLAETLAQLQGRQGVSLDHLIDALRTVFFLGSDGALPLVRNALLIGEDVIGQVAPNAMTPPLRADFDQQVKRLRLTISPDAKLLELDLRKPLDMERSVFLHRLLHLGMRWGTPERNANRTGTFRENWTLAWTEHNDVELMSQSRHGVTVEQAANRATIEAVRGLRDLGELTRRLEGVVNASLLEARDALVHGLKVSAAVSDDTLEQVEAWPNLANVVRYGNVRGTAPETVRPLLNVLGVRIMVNLPLATASIDEDLAQKWAQALDSMNGAVRGLGEDEFSLPWFDALRRMSESSVVNAKLRGRAVKHRHDAQRIEREDLVSTFSLALSDPETANVAAWAEGFLEGSGGLLTRDQDLFDLLNGWLAGLSVHAFTEVLVMLRRVFATMTAGDRIDLAKMAGGSASVVATRENLDHARAWAVVERLSLVLPW